MPELLLHDFFLRSAQRWPDRPALDCGGVITTYRTLALQSAMGAQVIEAAVGRDGVIGIVPNRSSLTYAAILAVLRSGNCYAPLRDDLPLKAISRLAQTLQMRALVLSKDAKLLSDPERRDVMGSLPTLLYGTSLHDGSLIPLFDSAHQYGVFQDNEITISPASAAYLIQTSGSTGNPKAVSVAHESASACVRKIRDIALPTSLDRFSQFNDLCFDFSVSDMFLCWGSGGCLVVPSRTEIITPDEFARIKDITIWSSVPTLARNACRLRSQQAEPALPVRLTLFCGEALPYELVTQWRQVVPNSRILNLYGPTEAAFSIYFKERARCFVQQYRSKH